MNVTVIKGSPFVPAVPAKPGKATVELSIPELRLLTCLAGQLNGNASSLFNYSSLVDAVREAGVSEAERQEDMRAFKQACTNPKGYACLDFYNTTQHTFGRGEQ